MTTATRDNIVSAVDIDSRIDGEQSVVKVWCRTETGEAPLHPTAHSTRSGDPGRGPGATTENTGCI